MSANVVKTWVAVREETGTVGPERKRDGWAGIVEQGHFTFLTDYLNGVNCQLFGDAMSDLLEEEFDVRYSAKLL